MKNELQTERMKNYFLTAAKEIICAEGIAAVSTRTIAERAGYSYATIYNYFKDINELIFEASKHFMNECSEFVRERVQTDIDSEKYLRTVTEYYAQYFVQYPSVFTLLFFRNTSTKSIMETSIEKAEILFDSFFEGVLDISTNKFKSYKFALHGFLLFSLNQGRTLDYSSFTKELKNIVY